MKRLILILLASCGAVYAQQNALLLPWTPQQFTNTNGTVLANGKVCTYLAGTSTGVATYTDATAATPNNIPPNAILLDSTGRPTSGGIWLKPTQAYKIVVLTAGSDGTCNTGVTIKTQDNVGISGSVSANNTWTGTQTYSNNNFLRWFKADGVTPVNVIGVDSSNNTNLTDNAGNGLFFKVGGVGTGNVAPSPSSSTYPLVNFVGNLGWNNMTINPASFGLNPGANPAAWTASAFQFGQTDATQNANAFTNTFQIKMNNSGTNVGNVEKGGAFFNCLDNDTTATTVPACVGFDSLAEGPTANTNSSLWGGVMRFQIDSGGGDGSGFGLEIDSTNNGTGNNNHGEVSKHKTGLWFAAFGAQPASWMIDSNGTGTAWNNGISLRNITPGGIGMELPNNIGLYWKNAANNADLKNIVVDNSNNMILDTGAAATGMFFRINGSNVALAQSTGWSSMNLTSPTINLLNNGTGVQIFNTTTTCTTGASVGATCTTAAISLPVTEADTSYRISCTGKGPTAVPVISSTANSSASQFTITIAALTAVAASYTSYDCVAGHN